MSGRWVVPKVEGAPPASAVLRGTRKIGSQSTVRAGVLQGITRAQHGQMEREVQRCSDNVMDRDNQTWRPSPPCPSGDDTFRTVMIAQRGLREVMDLLPQRPD